MVKMEITMDWEKMICEKRDLHFKRGDKIIRRSWIEPLGRWCEGYFIVENIRNNEIYIKKIEEPSIDQKYDLPLNSPFGEVLKRGGSCYSSRRFYYFPLSFTKQETWVIEEKARIQDWPPKYECEITRVIADFPDLDDYERKKNWLEEQRLLARKKKAEEELRELKWEGDIARVEFFNKTALCHEFPDDLMIIHSYTTSCGNTHVLIAPKKSMIKVPDKWKGLIIGKKGANIREIQEKYKIKIQII